MAKTFPYYSMIVYLHEQNADGSQREIRLRNLTIEQVSKYRDEIYTKGLRVEITARCWEIISPMNINKIMILGEEDKF